MSQLDAKMKQAIDRAHQALIINIDAGQAAIRRSAPREALEYHLDLAHKALRNLRNLSAESNLPAYLREQAE